MVYSNSLRLPLTLPSYNNHHMFIPCISPGRGRLVLYLYTFMHVLIISLAENPARQADLVNVVLLV